MRIGFLISHIANGGAAKSLLLLLKRLATKKYDIIIYVKCIKDEKLYDDFKTVSSKIIKIDLPLIKAFDWESTSLNTRKTLLVKNKKEIKTFIDLLTRERIDILHVNTTQYSYLNENVKKNNIILVSHVRELLSPKLKTAQIVVSEIKQFSDAIIAISPNEAEIFNNHPNLIVIPNPIDIVEVAGEDKRENINEVLVGMMSSFHPLKKHLLFLRAINYLKKSNKIQNTRFVIVGVNEREPYWKLIAKALIRRNTYALMFYSYLDIHNLNLYVKLYPNIKDVGCIYKCLDIYVRPDGHPWGRDIIEAMAYKIPVIAIGKSDFFIKNGKTGVLINAADYRMLAAEILKLANDHLKRITYSDNAYKLICENCSDIYYAQKIENLYFKIKENK